MKNPFVITAIVSLVAWAVFIRPVFTPDSVWAWVATILLIGWGVFGLAYSARGGKGNDDESK